MKIEMFFKWILSYSDWTDFKKFCIFRRIKVCQHNSKSPTLLKDDFPHRQPVKPSKDSSPHPQPSTPCEFLYFIYMVFLLKKYSSTLRFAKTLEILSASLTILYGFPIFRERTVIPNRNINVSFSCVWIYVCLSLFYVHLILNFIFSFFFFCILTQFNIFVMLLFLRFAWIYLITSKPKE